MEIGSPRFKADSYPFYARLRCELLVCRVRLPGRLVERDCIHELLQVVAVAAIPNVRSFLAYIRKLVRLRRADTRNDLLSALIAAEEAGQQLNEDELLAMVFCY